jgi:hypothetical protein
MRAATAWLAIVFAVGCGSDSDVTSPTPSAVGTWALMSIDGTILPYTAYDGEMGKVELTGERLVIAGSTFTLYDEYRQTVNGAVTTVSDSLVGWATVAGTSARLVSYDAGIDVIGTVDSGRLTIDGGVPFVNSRR